MSNEPYKIFFDTCVSKPLADHFSQFFENVRIPNVQISHLNDHFSQNTADPDWLETLKNDDWLVITADAGKRGGPKLPRVCLELGITNVALWKTLTHARTDEKRLALIEVFNNLEPLFALPKGTQVRLIKRVKSTVVDYELRVGAKALSTYLEQLEAERKPKKTQFKSSDGELPLF